MRRSGRKRRQQKQEWLQKKRTQRCGHGCWLWSSWRMKMTRWAPPRDTLRINEHSCVLTLRGLDTCSQHSSQRLYSCHCKSWNRMSEALRCMAGALRCGPAHCNRCGMLWRQPPLPSSPPRPAAAMSPQAAATPASRWCSRPRLRCWQTVLDPRQRFTTGCCDGSARRRLRVGPSQLPNVLILLARCMAAQLAVTRSAKHHPV